MREILMFRIAFRRKLQSAIEVIVKIETKFTILIFGIMVLMNTVTIFSRAAFHKSFIWNNPLTLVLFSWLTFLGAAIIFYHEEYIVCEYFLKRLFPHRKKAIILTVDSVVIIFLIFVILEMPGLIRMQSHKMEILPLPTYIISLPILIGMITVVLIFVSQIWDILDGTKQQD